MSWHDYKSNVIPVKRMTQLEIYKAVTELEKRGYECIYPITLVNSIEKDYGFDKDNKAVYQGDRNYQHYQTKMRRVAE